MECISFHSNVTIKPNTIILVLNVNIRKPNMTKGLRYSAEGRININSLLNRWSTSVVAHNPIRLQIYINSINHQLRKEVLTFK